MEKVQIEKTLLEFVNSLSSEQIKELIVYGGCIGLSIGTDLNGFDANDFELVGVESSRASEIFLGNCFISIDAQQEFEADELFPLREEDDEEGITPERVTDQAVSRTREFLVDGVTNGGWVDELEEKILYFSRELE